DLESIRLVHSFLDDVRDRLRTLLRQHLVRWEAYGLDRRRVGMTDYSNGSRGVIEETCNVSRNRRKAGFHLGLTGVEQEFAAEPDRDEVCGRQELDAVVELDVGRWRRWRWRRRRRRHAASEIDLLGGMQRRGKLGDRLGSASEQG